LLESYSTYPGQDRLVAHASDRATIGKVMDKSDIYRDLFELGPSPSAVFTLEGECQLANLAFLNLLGLEREHVLEGDVTFTGLFPEPQAALNILDELQKRPVIRRREITLCDIAGNLIPVLFSGRTFELDGTLCFDVSLTSIADLMRLQHKLRKEHSRLSSLLESLSVGLLLVNRAGRVSTVNNPLCNILDLEMDAALDQAYEDIFAAILTNAREPEVVQQSLEHAVTTVAERPSIDIGYQYGDIRDLEASFFPVWDETGAAMGWGMLLQDVTASRSRLAWKLDLLSILAHDIRTPLATLKGHTTALLANYRQWSEAMITEFLEVMDRTTDDLTRQVDLSLSLTRVEAGQLGLRPEAVHPEDLLTQALERAAARLEGREVIAETPESLPLLRVDPARIEEVFINLLDNAAQYSPADTPIQISFQLESTHLHIAITNYGPSIPLDLQRTIFDKYVRNSSDQKGYGLGLFIARKIVEAHGGRIRVKSPLPDSERGACFVFSLPLMPEPLAEREASPSASKQITTPTATAEGEHVLVIEDEADQQTLLHTLLTQQGYSVDIAADGPSALDLVQTSPPDIVLLDWVLPEMSGLQVCRTLRRWSDVPILLVTSRTSASDLVLALDTGADDYISKPYESRELFARMRALLRRRQSSGAAQRKRNRFQADGLIIDFDSRDVWLRGEHIHLTHTEFDIIEVLTRNRGRVVTYDRLIEYALAEPTRGTRHDLFVHISRLRKKLEVDPRKPEFIRTRWGVGYIFSSV